MGLYKDWVHKLPEDKVIMETLTTITDDFVEGIKITHPQRYNTLIEQIEKLSTANHFTEEDLNESRTYVPEHFSIADTTSIAEKTFEIDFSKECFNEHDFNFITNEMYKLYNNIYQEDLCKYAELGLSWLDSYKGMALKYYTKMYIEE